MRSPGRTLFVRLLVWQTALVIAVVLVFAGLFYVERNRSLADLQAAHWAPWVMRQVSPPGDPAAEGISPVLQRLDHPPPGERLRAGNAPRTTALRDGLLARGVPLRRIAFTRSDDGPQAWLEVDAPGGGPVWLAMQGHLVESGASVRLLLGLGLAAILLVGATWVFTRRLTAPLQALARQLAGTRREDGATRPDATPLPRSAPPELHAIADAHAELLDRLARQDRERALLLAGVSHDLRSPLARIRLAAQLLPDAPEVQARRDAIVRNADVADRLIGSFLDHVRAGELPLDQSVDLAALARRVVDAYALPATELSLDAPTTLPLSRAHPDLLERVLSNLIDNARRHGRPPVAVAVRRDGDDVALVVSDHGPGLPPGAQAHLSQAFARGDASRGQPGTGLGLAVVQRVAQRLGGTVAMSHDGRVHRVAMRWPAG